MAERGARGLKTGWVIDEGPGEVKFFGKMLGQRFHAKGFRGVMAAIKNVESEFFRQGEGPVRSFARDKSVDAFQRRGFHVSPGAAGDDADAEAFAGAGGDEFWACSEDIGEAAVEFVARHWGEGFETDRLALVNKERFARFQPEPKSGEELDGVAQFGMGIEREMRAIDSEVVIEEGT